MASPLQDIDLDALELSPEVRVIMLALMNQLEAAFAQIEDLKAEIQRLRDENAHLKGEKGKPKFKRQRSQQPTAPPAPEPQAAKKPKPPRAERIEIDRIEVLQVDREALPEDAVHKGYREVTLQGLRFERDNVRYRLERFYSPSSGELFEAQMPSELQGRSYSPALEAFVIASYYAWRVPQKKIRTTLESLGIVISDGKISDILSRQAAEQFAHEQQAVIAAGLATTPYQHIDHTGGRHAGSAVHVTTLCNAFYGAFLINENKKAETVDRMLEPVTGHAHLSDTIETLVCDDAGEFRALTENRQLCWVHEIRHFRKLRPFYQHFRMVLDAFMDRLYRYYDELKAYRARPSPEEAERLSLAFDELFSTETGYDALDERIRKTGKKKQALLHVLAQPEVPLENNEAERALREVVVKRKISTGTRSDQGQQAWSVMLSLLDTCRKQGVSFYQYVLDRLSGRYELPPLSALVSASASQETEPVA